MADHAAGTRVDIGGYRLNIDCRGEGAPTVVLDAGLGGSSQDWRPVQEGVSRITRACIYDRAGYGRSDPGPLPRTSGRIVSELHGLLRRAKVRPPYVLVGHSFGGYNMRLYASRYPGDAVGLVLVDAPHEGQLDALLDTPAVRLLDPEGSLRELWHSDTLAGLSVNLQPLADALGLDGKRFQVIYDEALAFRESSAQLSAAPPSAEVPLVVIMHGRRIMPDGALGNEMEQQWTMLERQLAQGYRHHRFIIAHGSGHNIPLDEPALIIDAITDLIERWRTGR